MRACGRFRFRKVSFIRIANGQQDTKYTLRLGKQSTRSCKCARRTLEGVVNPNIHPCSSFVVEGKIEAGKNVLFRV
jgi:hypothetical protein